MCTLIAGIGVLGPGTLLVAANRDEAPDRPSDAPAVLRERPRVVGGRDRVAGGTWLAVREGRFVTALMNRRATAPSGEPPRAPATPPRSRGLLCLDAAAAPPSIDAPETLDPGTGERYPARRDAALRVIQRDAYGPCTLVGLGTSGEAWAIRVGDGGRPVAADLAPGWHVVTHVDPDDEGEPRTAWLLGELRGYEPAGTDEALDRLGALLRGHGDAGGAPPVCLHRARFPTVSSTLLSLGAAGPPRYLHAPGPPCVTTYADCSDLLR
ncbi:MAG TPA: NRDE family protein [Candidatus Eisenbacteria bacterium]